MVDPLTRSGSLVSTEGTSFDVVVNSAVSTQHYCQVQVVNTCDNCFEIGAMNFSIGPTFN